MIDYAANDKSMKYLADKEKIAEKLGFLFVSEAYENLYVQSCLSTSQIAEIFDITDITVRNALKRMGVELRPRGGRNHVKLTESQVIDIFNKALPDDELIETLSISNETLKDIRKGKTWKHVTAGQVAA